MSTTSLAAPLGDAPAPPGSVHVRQRVIQKVARQTCAATVGVARHDVDVDVADWDGDLAVCVAARLPVPDLADTEAVRRGPDVMERARRLQTEVAEEVGRLTGRQVRRVSFTVTGAIISARRNVR